MSWKPIVIGVDGSIESVRAAIAGAMIAQRAGTQCVLVGALPDYERLLASYGMMPDVAGVARQAAMFRQEVILDSLKGSVPDAMLGTLDLQTGRAPLVLTEAAKRHGAGLIVVGNKQHRGLERLRGGTARHLIRTCDVPLLIADGGTPAMARILVALDLSEAAGPTLAETRRWATLFSAEVRAIHVVEPMPVLPSEAGIPSEAYFEAEAALQTTGVWAELDEDIEKVLRVGHAAPVIEMEVGSWHADLLVLGSHGRGWVSRLLVGSTTEQLAHRPPTLTLVVPVGRLAAEAPEVDVNDHAAVIMAAPA